MNLLCKGIAIAKDMFWDPGKTLSQKTQKT